MAIIISSTMSDSGKSFVTAGLVRILDGIPFKAQNMSLNSYPSIEGGEMAFIQAFQAMGSTLEPSWSMNPVLLKPSGNGIEVILFGKSLGNMSAKKYYSNIGEIWKKIRNLVKKNTVIEAAGGIEPNFMDNDMTAILPSYDLKIPIILVLDIDRGGSFSSAYGVYNMVPPSIREKLSGFIINKLRGEEKYLEDGINWLTERTGMKYLGSIPYIDDVPMMAEDSMNIKDIGDGEIEVGVIAYPYMSNFNEFQALEKSNARVRFIRSPKELKKSDVIVLPGTRNTYESLVWLVERGFSEQIKKMPTLGICGGFQIMGKKIVDLHGIESGSPKEYQGLGIFDIDIIYEEEKVVSRSVAESEFGIVEGYEIRRGKIEYNNDKPLFKIFKRNNEKVEVYDGALKGDKIGTSLHGSLYSSLNLFGIKNNSKRIDEESREKVDKIARILRKYIDVETVEQIYTSNIV
ncbi:cobyric acid synthase [Acidianus sp. RZ1]|uniref:cobyric acid synthase n=1 Tax=Acidianus sp. RZ1 TaxID=1540082 RepID=UPI001492F253|nr:cobyric acid synthase [Acidianus sp. RZ1]